MSKEAREPQRRDEHPQRAWTDAAGAPLDSAEALRHSEERFRSVFENAAIGKAIARPDTRFLQVNRAYCEMVGYTQEELLQLSPAAFTHPDDKADNAALIDRLLAGEVSTGRTVKRYVHRAGHVVWGDLTLTLMRDADGRPSYFIAEVVDVTEQKRIEDALRISEERFRAAFQNAAIGKALTSPDMRFLQVNRAFCAMLGYTEAELLQRSPAELTHAEDRPASAALVARLLAAEAPSARALKRYLHKDGHVVWGDLTTSLVRDAQGEPSYFASEIVDVTERRRAEELVRDRETKLVEAQRIAHLVHWEHEVESDRSSWSGELRRLGADEPEDGISTDGFLQRIHPDDRPRVAALIERAYREGTPFEYEARVPLPSGEVRWIHSIARTDLDANGRLVRLYGVAQDITERRRAEQALRASEQRFRNLFTQTPVLMTVVGPDGRFREVSDYWLARFGYAREEVIGREAREFVTPESHALFLAALQATVQRGEIVVRNTPLVGVRKDGSHVDALITALLEFDEQRAPAGVVTVGLDISDLRRAEEAVRESEARYRALVEHAPEAITVLDVASGRFVDLNANAERMFGRTRAQILGLGPLDFAPATQPDGTPSAELARHQIERVRAGETPVFEFVCTHASGREFPCEIRLARLPARERELIRSSVVDISELKFLHEKARHDDRMAAIGVLAAGVAHEIGNPLLALSMAVQSLERKATEEYAQKKLALVREHIERISKIVRQMSDLARPRASRRTSCDLNRVLERTLEIVRYDKRAKEVRIDFAPAADAPFVQAVEDQLMQVCLNLCLNALDAVAANPPGRARTLAIRTEVARRGARAFLRAAFRDSGPGIPEALRARVFQPFFTTKEAGKGTGLGLSVSARIIEQHEGTLAFECGAGDGTEFFFELPSEVPT